jgi:hypothetical protein
VYNELNNSSATLTNSDSGITIGGQTEPGITLSVEGQDFHLGYSRIASYLTCPKQYAFTYNQKIPYRGSSAIRKGQAFHATLESLLNYKMEYNEAMPLASAERVAVKAAKAEKLTDNQSYNVIDGVRHYHANVYPLHKPAAVEESFTIHRGGVNLTGRIDLVDTRGHVIDHKFSHAIWDESKAKTGVQPIIYQWAGLDYIAPKYNLTYTGFQYNVTQTWPECVTQVIDLPLVSQDQSDWWEEQVEGIAKAILAGVFFANPSERACKWCQYIKQCKPTMYTPWISLLGSGRTSDID